MSDLVLFLVFLFDLKRKKRQMIESIQFSQKEALLGM